MNIGSTVEYHNKEGNIILGPFVGKVTAIAENVLSIQPLHQPNRIIRLDTQVEVITFDENSNILKVGDKVKCVSDVVYEVAHIMPHGIFVKYDEYDHNVFFDNRTVVKINE